VKGVNYDNRKRSNNEEGNLSNMHKAYKNQEGYIADSAFDDNRVK
jgi:hypothetical protein